MKKRILSLVALILCGMGVLCIPVSAQSPVNTEDLYREQSAASGAEELWKTLPEETRRLLKAMGLEGLDSETYTALQPGTVLEEIVGVFSEQAGGVAAVCGALLGAVFLGALAEGARQTVQEPKMAETFSVLCAAAIAGTILLPVSECVGQACEAARSVSVFMLSFVPAYGAVLVSSGQATMALSYSTVLLTGAECVSALTTDVVTPLLTVSLGVGGIGALTEKNRLSALGGLLNKLAGWLLATATALFSAMLSFQSVVASSADSLGQRAAKMSIGAFVPVVGGPLSEAFGTVTGCLRLLRSTLGAFGAVAAVGLILPAVCRCAAWALALAVGKAAAEALGVRPAAALAGAAQGVIKTLIGVLAASGLFMIVTTTVVTMAGGGS